MWRWNCGESASPSQVRVEPHRTQKPRQRPGEELNLAISPLTTATSPHRTATNTETGAPLRLRPLGQWHHATLGADIETCFEAAPAGSTDTHTEHDKGHGRIEQRDIDVIREVDWLSGDRRFPGELRLPDAASIIRVRARVQRGATAHAETRA